MESSVTRKLSNDLEIRVVTAPYFIATKLEAYKGRGKGDFVGSHDLEDLVSVVDGRENLGRRNPGGAGRAPRIHSDRDQEPAWYDRLSRFASRILASGRREPVEDQHRVKPLKGSCLHPGAIMTRWSVRRATSKSQLSHASRRAMSHPRMHWLT
jgi:hypothetical protein